MMGIWKKGTSKQCGGALIDFTRLAPLVVIVIMTTVSVGKGDEICSQAKLDLFKDSLQCHLQVISWVEVAFQGKLLEEHKHKYERLVRLRLRNDLSMMKHETVRYVDALKKYGFDSSSSELKKRGGISCLVWTVGEDYPVAQLVECELWGYGKYSISREFSGRVLGYSSSKNADEQVRASIREIMANISADLLEARDLANQ